MAKASGSVVKPLSGVRKYASVKVKRFIEGYEELMLKRFPSTYRMIQMFTAGTKNFSSDVFQYMKTSKDLAFNRPVEDLSYKELSNYRQAPKDLRKMTPFLLVSSVPFAQYVTLPLAFLFPKQILSRHYWNIEQRTRFAIQDHTKKLYYYRPLFRNLQKKLDDIQDKDLHEKCRKVFSTLGSGTHPTVPLVLELSPLFTSGPYSLDSLSHAHLITLCKIHSLNILPGKKIRLKKFINFIKVLDISLDREDWQDKSLEDLKQACFLRGLNPALSRDEMIEWLNHWIHISKSVKEENLSLLLHAPIFLAYNQPSNWRLIH